MEYEVIVIVKQVYRVCLEADDDDAAQERAVQMVIDDDDGDVEILNDTIETIIDNVYEP